MTVSYTHLYLCMARVAHREGYPEIGLYWEKAAYEEAEHAAKFAEMLGEDPVSYTHLDVYKRQLSRHRYATWLRYRTKLCLMFFYA